MGLIIPVWLWLPVVLWVLWKYERRNRQRLEMRWVSNTEDERRLIESGYGRPLLLEEKKRRPRHVGAGVLEMRSIVITGVVGLLAALLWAWQPGAENSTSSEAATAAQQVASNPAQPCGAVAPPVVANNPAPVMPMPPPPLIMHPRYMGMNPGPPPGVIPNQPR
jgi:hypothetical protein